MKLTSRQREVFEYLKHFFESFQYMPTTRDIADNFGIRQNAAVEHLKAIEEKGYISRSPHKARAIRITRSL